MIYGTLPGTGLTLNPGGNVPNPGGPNYVMEFDLCVSADASGVFELDFIQFPASLPVSAYFTPVAELWPSTLQPLQIIIGPPIPTMSGWGMMVFGGLMIGVALLVMAWRGAGRQGG